jgi:hypothetical protein
MVALNWCLAFPYCPNEPIRAQAWEIVSAFYDKHFPDVPQLVHSATAVGETFLRAKTRNELVRMADSFDIICMIDADTLIHPDGIKRMLERVAIEPMLLGKPFLKGINQPLNMLASTADSMIWPRPKFNDPGAAWVIRPETWWAAGGMDESFRSWGGEDEAFNYLLTAVGGTAEYDQLPAVKTLHTTPRWSQDPQWADTWERSAVYRHIWLHPELATEWLAARDQEGIAAEWVNKHDINMKRRL